MTGGDRPDGGVLEITQGQKHGVRLYDAENPPRELLEPRLPAAPMKWLCITRRG